MMHVCLRFFFLFCCSCPCSDGPVFSPVHHGVPEKSHFSQGLKCALGNYFFLGVGKSGYLVNELAELW